MHRQGLVVVSNRLPVVLNRDDGGGWEVKAGSGGLVTALLPVLRGRGGTWIGWPGASDTGPELQTALDGIAQQSGYALKAVALTPDDVKNFYLGFSNEIVWPLFHDLHTLCNFRPAYWQTYLTVNRRYAEGVAANSTDADFIWVHDYHLMHTATELRKLGRKSQLGFFLHIPFPSVDIFSKLPWRFQLLRALLEYDLIGFQTLRDRRNFVDCVRTLMDDVRIYGSGQVLTARVQGREVRIGSFPISIDFNTFVRRAARPEVVAKVAELKALLPNRELILGVDRLDYTKGITNRLEAFRNALERYPELHERVTLIQVVVPSREDIPEYHSLKTRIERLVGEINGQFTRPGGWVPIHYVFRSLARADLLAYYRAAQIALVTPLKDGMNLVAKEFCACSIEEDCTLILSEFAGAAAELQSGALLVNPYDTEGVADAIHRACAMPLDERRARMRRLRRTIRRKDIFHWVDSFLHAAIAKDLDDFPLPADYVPREEPLTEDAIPL